MEYSICWNTERVREILTTESRQKSRELFLQTHYPFRRIHVDFCKETNTSNPFISEEQLRTILMSRPIDADNRLFFIVGEAGSGKSELSQWLEYTIDDPTCMPIHIPRSMTTAVQVGSLLRQQLYSQGVMSQSQQLSLDRQIDYITLTMVVMVYERDFVSLNPPSVWEPLLTGNMLRDDINQALTDGGSFNGAAFIRSSDRLRELCAYHMISLLDSDIDTINRDLNLLIRQAIDHIWWVSDIRYLLTRLSQDAIKINRRPLLLIEDITAFQIFGDILLDYLLDLTSGHFDALIGVTTGFERTQLAHATFDGDLTHIHQRLRGRFVLTDKEGRAYGLEENLVAFTQGYLNAIHADCHNCLCKEHDSAPFGSNLYPFTETMLFRAFHHLHEAGNLHQTPRLFLEHIVGAVLLSTDIPAVVLDRSLFLTRPPALFRTDNDITPCLESVLRWYGELDTDVIRIDQRILNYWGLPLSNPVLQDGYVIFPRTYVINPSTSMVNTVDWQRELYEFQAWIEELKPYPSRETLKRGIERVLFMFGDPRVLGNPHALALSKAEIVYTRGDERLPIILHHSGDIARESIVAIHIDPTIEERSILEELTYLALSNDSITQISGNLALTFIWAEQHWTRYRHLLQEHLNAAIGFESDSLILLAWKLMSSMLGCPWDGLPTLKPYASQATYQELTCWLPTQRNCYTSGSELFEYYEVIRRLFIGIFCLQETLIDEERYNRASNTLLQKQDALGQLACINVAKLRTLPFKIRPLGISIYQVLIPLQRYASALIEIDIKKYLSNDRLFFRKRYTDLLNPTTNDLSNLKGLLERLRRYCGLFGIAWDASWDNAYRTLHIDTTNALLQSLSDDIMGLLAELDDQESGDMYTYQAWLHRSRSLRNHPYWFAVEQVRKIQVLALQNARSVYRRKLPGSDQSNLYESLAKSIQLFKEEISYAKTTMD